MIKNNQPSTVSVIPQYDYDEWKHSFITLYLKPQLTKLDSTKRALVMETFKQQSDFSRNQGDSIAALEAYVLLKLKPFFNEQNTITATDMYLDGECGVFAVALARFFGKKATIYIMSRNDGEKWSADLPYEVTHVFVIHDRKTYDAKGKRSLAEMAKDFGMDQGGYTIKGPYPEPFFKLLFVGDSDTKPLHGNEQDIVKANNYIKKNIELFKTAHGYGYGAYPVTLDDVNSMEEYEKDQIDRFFMRHNGFAAAEEVFNRKIKAVKLNKANDVKRLRTMFKANFVALRHEDNLQAKLNKCAKVFDEQVALLKSSK